MTSIPVIARNDTFETFGDAQLTSLDGERVAPVGVVLHESWTAAERAEFGVYMARAAEVPDGKVVTSSRFEMVDGGVVQVVELEDAPVVVPTSVTPRQLRLALHYGGKLAQVEQFVASGQAPQEAKIAWEYAVEFLRTDPMLEQFAHMLGMSEQDVDAMFVAAAQIK